MRKLVSRTCLTQSYVGVNWRELVMLYNSTIVQCSVDVELVCKTKLNNSN